MPPQAALYIANAAYRRNARRLRARFCRHPAALHRALGELSRQYDRQLTKFVQIDPSPESQKLSDDTTAAIERAFSQHVAESLNGPVLRYSDRLKLLEVAERLRIKRFRANLLIAMVQHETIALSVSEKSPPPPRWSVVRIVAFALGCELAMVAAAFWVLHA
jgi:hypothetical protein